MDKIGQGRFHGSQALLYWISWADYPRDGVKFLDFKLLVLFEFFQLLYCPV